MKATVTLLDLFDGLDLPGEFRLSIGLGCLRFVRSRDSGPQSLDDILRIPNRTMWLSVVHTGPSLRLYLKSRIEL